MDSDSPVGWLCILPPLLTIVLAIVSKRVVVSLLFGIAVAIVILQPSYALRQSELGESFSTSGFLLESIQRFVIEITENQLWSSLKDESHLRVFLFTSVLGMQVALIHRSGGMEGIVRWAAPLARTRRGGQVLTWLLGLVIFIDDYANTLLLGSTMRPITDRLKISREKLAFLVDSTAAPVSGLALVSTWVATEISTMQAGYLSAGIDVSTDAFGIFIETIPSRFYILYTLAFVLFSAVLCRDFGPMLKAENRAQRERPDLTAGAPRLSQSKPRAFNAVLPICLTVAVAIWLITATGYVANGDKPVSDSWWEAAGQIVGQGDSYVALVYGALAGLAAVLMLVVFQRDLSSKEIRESMLEGFVHVLPAMVILWLAWTLSTLTGDGYLQTGQFLANKVTELSIPSGLLPTFVFLFASIIAFSTGTSWGTMAILMPIVVPLVYGLLAQQAEGVVDTHNTVLVASIGSVLAGAIFGDHCSPISDTTILSSRSSHCDHIAHVRTQMPYALTIAAVSIVLGTLPAGFGIGPWITLPLGLIALLAILVVFGRAVTPFDDAASPHA